jgi:hypothetical protein
MLPRLQKFHGYLHRVGIHLILWLFFVGFVVLASLTAKWYVGLPALLLAGSAFIIWKKFLKYSALIPEDFWNPKIKQQSVLWFLILLLWAFGTWGWSFFWPTVQVGDGYYWQSGTQSLVHGLDRESVFRNEYFGFWNHQAGMLLFFEGVQRVLIFLDLKHFDVGFLVGVLGHFFLGLVGAWFARSLRCRWNQIWLTTLAFWVIPVFWMRMGVWGNELWFQLFLLLGLASLLQLGHWFYNDPTQRVLLFNHKIFALRQRSGFREISKGVLLFGITVIFFGIAQIIRPEMAFWWIWLLGCICIRIFYSHELLHSRLSIKALFWKNLPVLSLFLAMIFASIWVVNGLNSLLQSLRVIPYEIAVNEPWWKFAIGLNIQSNGTYDENLVYLLGHPEAQKSFALSIFKDPLALFELWIRKMILLWGRWDNILEFLGFQMNTNGFGLNGFKDPKAWSFWTLAVVQHSVFLLGLFLSISAFEKQHWPHRKLVASYILWLMVLLSCVYVWIEVSPRYRFGVTPIFVLFAVWNLMRDLQMQRLKPSDLK